MTPPERLDRYMARAADAYYAARDPFADFTTAPEISQAFGEVLGAWAAATWQAMGEPDPVLLVELGPGRGTLMADALRAVARPAPGFRAALRLHLVERSPRLRALQAERLAAATWHDDIATLPDGPAIVIANEFLDALPVRQFVRRGDGWTERHVLGAGFVELPSDPPPDPPPGVTEGAVVEVGEAARAVIAGLAARDAVVALFIDYGPTDSAPGDSLQAIRDGRPADPLADPGRADITAHVDFAALARVARAAGAAVHGPVPLGPFLAAIGLHRRTERLARGAPPAVARRLMQGLHRLTDPHAMGRLFKAMAVCDSGAPSPPGFDAA